MGSLLSHESIIDLEKYTLEHFVHKQLSSKEVEQIIEAGEDLT